MNRTAAAALWIVGSLGGLSGTWSVLNAIGLRPVMVSEHRELVGLVERLYKNDLRQERVMWEGVLQEAQASGSANTQRRALLEIERIDEEFDAMRTGKPAGSRD